MMTERDTTKGGPRRCDQPFGSDQQRGADEEAGNHIRGPVCAETNSTQGDGQHDHREHHETEAQKLGAVCQDPKEKRDKPEDDDGMYDVPARKGTKLGTDRRVGRPGPIDNYLDHDISGERGCDQSAESDGRGTTSAPQDGHRDDTNSDGEDRGAQSGHQPGE